MESVTVKKKGIITSKFQTMVRSEILSHVEFVYLGVSFTGSEGRMEQEVDRFGGASEVIWTPLRVKQELSRKVKLLIYWSICVPPLNCSHELWVVTERTRSQIQVATISFPCRLSDRSLREKVRSSVIQPLDVQEVDLVKIQH